MYKRLISKKVYLNTFNSKANFTGKYLSAPKCSFNCIRGYSKFNGNYNVHSAKKYDNNNNNNNSRFSLFAAVAATVITVGTTAIITSNKSDASFLSNTSSVLNKPPIDPKEVVKHNKPDDCWIVINNVVYDLTDFIAKHPGGPDIIQSNAGKDVSAIFNPLHASDVIDKYIKPECQLGPLKEPLPESYICPPLTPGETAEDVARKAELRDKLPPLDSLINLYDFEYLASQILTKQAWGYYSSAADDEVTYRENHAAYHRIFFKPRILINVKECDLSTTMLGTKMDLPFYVSATALCKLGNPSEGEKDIARGCGMGEFNLTQMISTLASCSLKEIVEAKVNDKQTQWFQLYVNADRKITDNLIKNVEELGLKAIFVTVDAPSLGRREKDMKIKFDPSKTPEITNEDKSHKKQQNTRGASKALSTFIDPSLTWNDVIDIKKKTKLPVVIKGVQCTADILKAAEIGVDGVVLSNHGGRQLDFSRAPIEVLAEAMPILKEKGLDKKLEVYIDGGVRRGTDVLKALCLGAKGVGLGRPFLYANSCYGKDGVNRLKEMLADEIEMNMRLLGVTKISDLKPEYLDMISLHARSVNVPKDNLYQEVYIPSTTVEFLDE
ncbi:probable Cytochrome b2, mitochondrial [Saccharomycodes ludwigii]|uniref:L-lactate dehydrogenase (cytochrome) n=1 Tax=Saccharomycodes ludwigii TaxID=36035 RepID=A0A376B3V4_9ASCO|nr:probable Cytochrome b2, mitochondrial [Saccharomycodes ludwigii]